MMGCGDDDMCLPGYVEGLPGAWRILGTSGGVQENLGIGVVEHKEGLWGVRDCRASGGVVEH